jgi:hypothetical protein
MEKNLITIEKLSETSGTPLKILSSYVRKGFCLGKSKIAMELVIIIKMKH